MRLRTRFAAGSLVLALLACAGCLTPPGAAPRVRALQLSELAQEGDPQRRASLRLVLEGLQRDGQASPRLAMGLYERALQVDPTNPYAFLALARHHVEGTEPARALPFLDKAEALLRAQRALSPGVVVHLRGLRGVVLRASAEPAAGEALLDSARRQAPEVWSDGRLSAHELL